MLGSIIALFAVVSVLFLTIELFCRPRNQRGALGANKTIDLPTRVANIEGYLGLSPLSPAPAGTALPFFGQLELEAGDVAIGITLGLAVITKGSAAALTLAAPTAGVDDGKTLRIQSTTAFAHVVTVTGLENTDTTLTFGGNIGDHVSLMAYSGTWYITNEKNVAAA